MKMISNAKKMWSEWGISCPLFSNKSAITCFYVIKFFNAALKDIFEKIKLVNLNQEKTAFLLGNVNFNWKLYTFNCYLQSGNCQAGFSKGKVVKKGLRTGDLSFIVFSKFKGVCFSNSEMCVFKIYRYLFSISSIVFFLTVVVAYSNLLISCFLNLKSCSFTSLLPWVCRFTAFVFFFDFIDTLFYIPA